MELRDLLADARSSVKSFASNRRTLITIRCPNDLPNLNGTGPALREMVRCLLKEIIKSTPRGAKVVIAARAAGNGRSWVEVSLNSRKARLEERDLNRILKCAEPIRLVDVTTDLHRGELRLTLLCRLMRLRDGWFVIRRGGGKVPTFAVVLRAPTSRR